MAIVFAACGGTTASTAPSSAASTAPTTAPASASAPAFTAMNYPETGEAPCGEAAAPDATHDKYAGEFKKISAPDARTVVFDLCGSDVAFLSKIAFSSFAINDAGWLASHIDPAATDNQKIVSEANGTGPYKVKAWNRGQDVTYEAYDGYWGTKALTPTAILRWNKEAAQRLVELQAGTVDGIDNVGPTDFATVEGDANLQLKPRTGLNVFYLGFNNTFAPWDNEAVRQAIAKGIDRKRIVDNFYPGGSEVADYFTPCDIPTAASGRSGTTSTRRPPSRSSRPRASISARPTSSTSGRPSAGTCRIRRSSRPRSRPSSRPTSGSRSSWTSRTTRPTWTTRLPVCLTASTCSAGAPTTPTRPTSSTTTSEPARPSSSVTSSRTRRRPRRGGQGHQRCRA